MPYSIKRTNDEIDGQLNTCYEQMDAGGSRYPGMTFEEGVQQALDWVTGTLDEAPLPPDVDPE